MGFNLLLILIRTIEEALDVQLYHDTDKRLIYWQGWETKDLTLKP
jgi:hypothetical protein